MPDTSPALALLNPAPSPPTPTPTPTQDVALGRKKSAAVAMTAKALDGDVQGPDILTSTAHMIENLTADRAHALVAELTEMSDFNAFKLGGVLAKIHAEKWFGAHDNFKAYVEGVHGFGLSKATYLVGIYNALVDLGVSWAELKPIGWSKLKELSGIIDKANAQRWLAIAADADMTVMKLHELVKAEKAGGGTALLAGGSAAQHKVTFKLHDEQKETIAAAIAKAKQSSGTEHDSVAIEHIALDYLGNSEKARSAAAAMQPSFPAKPATSAPAPAPAEFTQDALVAHFKTLGPEESLALIDLAFPEANITVEITWPQDKGPQGAGPDNTRPEKHA